MAPTRVGRAAAGGVIVGGLWLVDRAQADAQQRRLVKQQQFLALATATTSVSDTRVACTATVEAQASATTQQAESTAEVARILSQATESASQLAAYRASLDAIVAAGQDRARATATARTSYDIWADDVVNLTSPDDSSRGQGEPSASSASDSRPAQPAGAGARRSAPAEDSTDLDDLPF